MDLDRTRFANIQVKGGNRILSRLFGWSPRIYSRGKASVGCGATIDFGEDNPPRAPSHDRGFRVLARVAMTAMLVYDSRLSS
jgi:hypothetical protein